MAQSFDTRVLLADNQAGATNAIALAVRSCDLIGTEVFGRNPGKRASRQQFSCGARVLQEVVSGGFNCYPTATQLDWLIERMIGDNISGYPASAATPGSTLPKVYAYVDKGDEIFRYDELVISSVTLTMNEGDYLDVRVDFVGKDETPGVTWPATPPTPDCDESIITPDVVFEYDATAYPFKQLTLSISNEIADNQHENAVKRTIFEATDLVVGLSGTFGYRTATKALYRDGIAGAVATIDMGPVASGSDAVTYTITLGNVKIPGSGPTIPESGEIVMQLAGMAYAVQGGAAQIEFAKLVE